MFRLKRQIVGLVALLALPTAAARAENFDERMRPPPAMSGAQLRTKMEGIVAVVADGLSGGMRLTEAWTSLEWQLAAAIDAGVSLTELESLGVARQTDGSYAINYGTHPDWLPLDARMEMVFRAGLSTRTASELIHRGLRDADIEALEYALSGRSWKADALARTRVLVSSFERRPRPGGQAGAAMIAAFVHQKNWIVNDSRRAWTLAAFNRLGSRGQRILESYLMEQKGLMVVKPHDPAHTASVWSERVAAGQLLRTIEAELQESP